MKKLWLVLLLPIVLFCSSALAQAENESVLISELSLRPIDNDSYWLELSNSSSAQVELEGWVLKNSIGVTIELSGIINPESYLVVAWEEPFLEQQDSLFLLDSNETIVDQWEFDLQIDEGQTLIADDTSLIITDLPTSGRANITYERPAMICEEVEVEATEETTIEEEVEAELPGEGEAELPEEETALQTAPLILSEIFANPEGSDTEGEFIELYNPISNEVSLDGWKLSDASKSFLLNGLRIDAGSYLTIGRTLSSIALNNTTESITLTDPFDEIIDFFSYESTTEGLSWNVGWYEAPPTAGLSNSDEPIEETVIEEEEVVEEATIEEETIEEHNDPIELILDPNLDKIILSEFLPNPVGSDDNEWIEIMNPTSSEIQLAGLVLTDGSVEYVFANKTIKAGGFLVIPRSESGISLNNSGDTLSLQVEGSFSDQFTYQESGEGVSWVRDENGSWEQTTTTTEGDTNIVVKENEPVAVASATKKTTTKKASTAPSVKVVTFDEWEKVEDESVITIEGVFSLIPGLLSTRTALLQSVDLAPPRVIELYFHKAEWSDVSQGQLVTVTGEKSVTQKGDRILIREADDIVLGEEREFSPYELNKGQNLEKSLDRLIVKASGTLMEQRKNELLVDINGQEVSIDIKTHQITLDILSDRSKIAVTGLFTFGDALKIMLFEKENLEVVSVEEEKPQEEAVLSILEDESNPIDWTIAKTTALSSVLSTSMALVVINREELLAKLKGSLIRLRNKATV